MKNEPTAELGTSPEARPAPAWDAREPASGTTPALPTSPSSPAPSTPVASPALPALAASPALPASPDPTVPPTSTSGAVRAPRTVSTVAHWLSRWPVAVLTVLLVVALGLAGYLHAAATAYQERLTWTEEQARAIGTDLATARVELEGTTAELEAVRGQLAAAQERITALADEKARIGDDREAQAQLLDYQGRVSEAAGTVASALDRCVQGQDQLITYLESSEQYDPAQLAAYGQSVERLCQSASEANRALQAELADR